MYQLILVLLCGLPLLAIIIHTIIRIIRHYHKFPMPEFAANIIDNPIRRKLQPPYQTAIRHGIEEGMRVLEIGPGNGTYTLGAAQRVGLAGKVIAIDIEPKMIDRVLKRIETEGINNVEARVADAYDLPFEDASFDLIYMIAVINEIPDIPKALREFYRVLKPNGRLVTSEIFTDPDYPLAKNLTKTIQEGSFQLKEKIGNFFYYTLIFTK
jgi:ubiquinone/menaquinone biosynthesis C-methylase UbiE